MFARVLVAIRTSQCAGQQLSLLESFVRRIRGIVHKVPVWDLFELKLRAGPEESNPCLVARFGKCQLEGMIAIFQSDWLRIAPALRLGLAVEDLGARDV